MAYIPHMKRSSSVQILVVGVLLAVACRSDITALNQTNSTAISETMQYVDAVDAYGELFVDVQMSRIFEDSKTFVDMVPVVAIDSLMSVYRKGKASEGFDLATFVKTYFKMPAVDAQVFVSDASLNLDKHIERLWGFLSREEEDQARGGTLLPLPYDYIVPGGRFREIYYWDSYFTMEGLLADGRVEDARHMVDNFAYLIETYGFIPNGNRSYYLSRSQPPFFAPMVALLAKAEGDEQLAKYLPALVKEHDFWMLGADGVTGVGKANLRVAKIAGDFIVNRYYDNSPRPRPEGYAEDSLLSKDSSRPPAELYLNLRAACESGWDFSSRWLADPQRLATIRTTEIAPVDLNSLLYSQEDLIAKAYEIGGNDAEQAAYAKLAYERRRAILTKFYSSSKGFFMDYDLTSGKTTPAVTLAGVYPLFFEIATEEQAAAVADVIRRDFLRPGGLVTSLVNNGQQWDAPNGWPPLQWMAIDGLRKYGHTDLAREIAERWLAGGRKVYANTGKVVEKYNVADTTIIAGGGEYPNQDGFGWSNGVFARLISDYPGI